MSIQDIAYRPAGELRAMQEEKLQALLSFLNQYSPFYRRVFKNIDIQMVRKLEDLAAIPVTTKEDLQKFNWDFLCVDKNRIAEYTSTSGTLGDPVTIALTENDLDRLAYNEFMSFSTAGGSPEDIYQLMLTLDRQFMAGIAYYSGARKMGAGVIRLGPGAPSLQWETIQRLQPTTIVAVPSFICKLIDYAQEKGIDFNQSSVKKAICIGEGIRNPDFSFNVLGKKIKESWNIHLFSTYASTEMQTAFTECREGKGGHLRPELLIVELLDDLDQPVPPGTPGEVTITTLAVEGMPLLRYKTGDICTFDDRPCACGRHSLRLSPLLGRKKQMIKFKGTTLYPSVLFDLLNGMSEIRDYIVEVSTNKLGLDEVLLYLLPVALTEDTDHKVRAWLQARLRVTPFIKYVGHEELQRMQVSETNRKPIKFIDKRGDAL
ncbi:AMP-binding protein [Flavitalea sp. BT771]|uniref:phenylacetate--CoA ligase family protein n=1 Tax=Flavitalea sp. BT771 TaxID=3063329 RepID=UPI0026E32745|nr:AMP-binding protein [Flavitalea sp. BT771]MDO6429972.1 AMP-binding protein [Flavitalea sp. BT771]MDV6217900.1 AMP-binding protein [Flavitalea sp. BT771]